MNDSTKKRSWVTLVVILAASAVLVFALFNIVNIGGGYVKSQNLYKELASYATVTTTDATEDSLTVSGKTSGRLTVDFASLQAINPDIVAWIYLPDTMINYPVTIGRDNDYYISHNADHNKNSSGAIFLDMNNQPDFTDQNTVIYGHNMKDGSMFATLHEYENEQFFASHPTIYLYTPDGKEHTYRIFAAYVTDAVSDTYMQTFASGEAFLQYVDSTKQKSAFPSDVAINENSKLLTLSTCVQGQDSKRYVVVAVKES